MISAGQWSKKGSLSRSSQGLWTENRRKSISTKLELYFSLLLRRHLLGLWKWNLKPRSRGAHQPRTPWLRRQVVGPEDPLSLCARKPSEKWKIQRTPWSASLHQLVQLQKGWRCPGVMNSKSVWRAYQAYCISSELAPIVRGSCRWTRGKPLQVIGCAFSCPSRAGLGHFGLGRS